MKKLCCKKDIFQFKKDHWYNFIINTDNRGYFKCFVSYNEDVEWFNPGKTGGELFRFGEWFNYSHRDEYFYTYKELRKLKLEKLIYDK